MDSAAALGILRWEGAGQMKVALIQPRSRSSEWDPEFHCTTSTSRFCEPLQLGYIGAVARQKGHEVKIIHQVNQPLSEVVDEVLKFQPRVVGISAMTFERSAALELADRLISVPIRVLGGCDATANPYLVWHESISFVITGEGEYSFNELLRWSRRDYLEDAKKWISGLAYLDGDRLKINPPQRIVDLDNLPFPLRDSLDMSVYKEFTPSTIPYPDQRFASIINSRGCPNECGFCQNDILWNGKKNSRSAANVVDEIEYLQKTYGTNQIWFWDPNPLTKDLSDISNEILRRNVKIKWHCFFNPVQADLSLFQLMHDAGCELVNSGVESGCDQHLAEMNKLARLEQTAKSVGLAHKAGLFQHGSYMVGYPNESKEEFYESFRVLKSLGLDSAVFYYVTPLEGTQFHHFCVYEKYIITDRDPDHYDLSHPVIRTRLSEEMGKREYQDLLSWCYRNFYDKDWLQRAEGNPQREGLMNFAKVIERRYNLDFSEVKK